MMTKGPKAQGSCEPITHHSVPGQGSASACSVWFDGGLILGDRQPGIMPSTWAHGACIGSAFWDQKAGTGSRGQMPGLGSLAAGHSCEGLRASYVPGWAGRAA